MAQIERNSQTLPPRRRKSSASMNSKPLPIAVTTAARKSSPAIKPESPLRFLNRCHQESRQRVASASRTLSILATRMRIAVRLAKSEVLLHERGERAEAATLLDKCVSPLCAQATLHHRRATAHRALGA